MGMSNKSLALAAILAAIAIIAVAAFALAGNGNGDDGTSISLDASSVSMETGDTKSLTATVTPSTWKGTVNWSSSDESVATVDSSGKITAVSAGKATITAKADSSRATCEIIVADASVPTAAISLSSGVLSLNVGDTATLTAAVTPSDSSDVLTWKSSDISVATVSSDGKVTAIAAGSATITATYGSVSGACEVTVNPITVETDSISLSDSSSTLSVGKTLTLAAAVMPSNSTQPVSWVSSDGSVAVVSSDGKVTAIAAGTATITATSGSHSATFDVTVVKDSSLSVPSIDGLTITCKSGTADIVAYSLDSSTGEYTVTFGAISENTEYTMEGNLNGNVVIDVDETETYDFTLNLSGVSIRSEVESPIVIYSGDNVDISASKNTINTITDAREAVDSDVEGVYSGAIHSKVDLKLKGKGTLTVTSENNKGIHSKNDLEVKNLTLTVSCIDNALKGNDSVTITSGTITLYARQGDGIKTSDSDTKIKSDGSTAQRGIVTINSDDGNTSLTIYAACDGIDSSYDVVICETKGNSLSLNIYTDAYYSGAETVYDSSDDTLYLKVPSGLYSSSYTYYAQFSDGSSTEWVKASYLKAETGGTGFMGRTTAYYYYTLEKPSDAAKVTLYIYSGTPSSEASSDWKYSSSQYSLNSAKDMLVLSSFGSSSINISLGSYSASSGSGPGMGWMQEGNSNKTSYSAKGIKAANSISIESGTIAVSAGDDALHANHDDAIDADTKDSYGFGKGDITISGGDITLTSNDDGIHADGTLTITGGTIAVKNSYEGLEGGTIDISGGSITISSIDDGINGVATTNEDRGTVTAVYGYVRISGGYIYMVAGGDGIDSNCSLAGGLTISGGKVVVISTSSGNSAIDSNATYKYSGGYVLAICPRGMTQEMSNVSGGVYKAASGSLSASTYVKADYGSDETLVVKMPVSISNAYVFALYSSAPTITVSSDSSYALDSNGVYWSS
ncbi:MAG: carbohydrate-binding domain-containing protein [Candidatus Methanomethylophilaceae archaeon]|nr:carbohydrate-binding domain-containing protein [Candidatus Methanomethylophilaceae archaeon]